MKVLAATVFVLLAVSSLASAVDDSKVNRPVNKVIKLLKEMQVQLEGEQKEDEDVYDKLSCWCESNDKQKSKEIAEAEARITELTSTIEELTATSARLNQEIENLGKEIARNREALKKATAIREKEHNEFAEEAKDLTESITSLGAAIVVLSKHHAPPAETLLNIGALLKHQMHKHRDILAGVLTTKARRAIGSFLQGDFFGKAPAFKQAYAPQSGEIFGILTDMKEQFQNNLAAAQKEEDEAQKAFDELKAAKEAEIKAGEEQLAAKKAELAKTDEDNAQAKQDLEDTQGSLAADQKFLADLKEKCSQTDSEWEQRQADRQAEMQAVSEALAILTADDAHDTFVKTFNAGFVQKAGRSLESIRRQRAALVLAKMAAKTQDKQLAELAQQVRLDAFTRVKKAIDDMVSMLLKEQADEQAHRDWCVNERNQNDRTTETKQRDKSDLDALIEEQTQKIDALQKEIDTLNAEIADAQIQIKRAGEDREAENRDFQTTVTDQRETQRILGKAMAVMQAVYSKAMIQTHQGPPPPPGFSTYSKNAGGSGVIALLQTLIGDAKKMEAETVQAEKDSQAAYETFVKNTNDDIAAKQRQIVDNTEDKAKTESDRTQAEADRQATMDELEQLAAYSANLHASCDFIVKNYDIRQTARAQEIEALRQAKAILSGAQFSGAALIAKKH